MASDADVTYAKSPYMLTSPPRTEHRENAASVHAAALRPVGGNRQQYNDLSSGLFDSELPSSSEGERALAASLHSWQSPLRLDQVSSPAPSSHEKLSQGIAFQQLYPLSDLCACRSFSYILECLK